MSENVPKISVIVPMYNVEKYVSLCIRSILAQTFTDFELILVDDCSTDETLEIAKGFSDSRIKIFRNEKNMGKPGPVRNVGLDAARGEYVYFCDSDDVIVPNSLETLLNAVERASADVSNTTRRYIAANHDFEDLLNINVNLEILSEVFPVSSDLKTRLIEEFLMCHIHVSPGLSLYKRKFLLENNIKFPNEAAEDVFFNFDVVYATDKIIKIAEPLYIVRLRPESVSRNPKRVRQNIKSVFKLHDHIAKKMEVLNDIAFTNLILMYLTSHMTNTHIMPFINQMNKMGDAETMQKILEDLKVQFGENSLFVWTFIQLYCGSNYILNENQILKNKLAKIQEIAKI